MKTDLATSILAAVLGVAVSFLICNTLLPEIEAVSFKKLNNTDSNYSLTEPDVNVFNYRALNPTVEVYVGDCDEYDSYGNCITEQTAEETEEIIDDSTDESTDESTEDETVEPEKEPEEEASDGSTN